MSNVEVVHNSRELFPPDKMKVLYARSEYLFTEFPSIYYKCYHLANRACGMVLDPNCTYVYPVREMVGDDELPPSIIIESLTEGSQANTITIVRTIGSLPYGFPPFTDEEKKIITDLVEKDDFAHYVDEYEFGYA